MFIFYLVHQHSTETLDQSVDVCSKAQYCTASLKGQHAVLRDLTSSWIPAWIIHSSLQETVVDKEAGTREQRQRQRRPLPWRPSGRPTSTFWLLQVIHLNLSYKSENNWGHRESQCVPALLFGAKCHLNSCWFWFWCLRNWGDWAWR